MQNGGENIINHPNVPSETFLKESSENDELSPHHQTIAAEPPHHQVTAGESVRWDLKGILVKRKKIKKNKNVCFRNIIADFVEPVPVSHINGKYVYFSGLPKLTSRRL